MNAYWFRHRSRSWFVCGDSYARRGYMLVALYSEQAMWSKCTVVL